MKNEELDSQKNDWEKPEISVLNISLTEFECTKFGDFNDMVDNACNQAS
jgi:hypothetical protein